MPRLGTVIAAADVFALDPDRRRGALAGFGLQKRAVIRINCDELEFDAVLLERRFRPSAVGSGRLVEEYDIGGLDLRVEIGHRCLWHRLAHQPCGGRAREQ